MFWFLIGFLVGSFAGIFLLALLQNNKDDDII